MGLYLYVPTLPTFAQTRTADLAVVGVVLSMYGLWQAVVRLPLGIAADALGWRKPFILGGLVLAGLGAWMMGSSRGVDGLMVGRAITGLAAGAWVPLAVAFSCQFPPRQAVWASAVLTFISATGRMVATSLTGFLNRVGGYPLAFYLAVSVEAVAVLTVLLSRDRRTPRQQPAWGSIGGLVIRRDVLLPSLLGAICQYANWATTFGFLPILVKELGGSDVSQSILASMNLGLGILSALLVTAVVGRIKARRMVYLSLGLLSTGIVGSALAPSLAVIFGAQVLIGLGQGISYPVLMGLSIRGVAEDQRSTAMGVYQAIYATGMFGGPWTGGLLAGAMGIRPMLGTTGLACLGLGLVMTWRLVEPVDDEPAVRYGLEREKGSV
jgi:MFS family permease